MSGNLPQVHFHKESAVVVREDGPSLFQVGTQVQYEEDKGFISSLRPTGAYVRFWAKGEEGISLRTKANSEFVEYTDLFLWVPGVGPSVVSRALEEIQNESL